MLPETTTYKINQIKKLGFDVLVRTDPKGFFAHVTTPDKSEEQQFRSIAKAYGEDLSLMLSRLLKVARDYKRDEVKAANPPRVVKITGLLGDDDNAEMKVEEVSFAEIAELIGNLPPTEGCDCPACTAKKARAEKPRHMEDGLSEEMAAENKEAAKSDFYSNVMETIRKQAPAAQAPYGGPPKAPQAPNASIQSEVERIMTEAIRSLQRLVVGLRAVH